jgi:hypothetical protein
LIWHVSGGLGGREADLDSVVFVFSVLGILELLR